MSEARMAVRTSYDRVASEYAEHLLRELDGKPLDRALLDVFAETVGSRRPVIDVGCGPGQAARYLFDRGVAASGLDLSPEMVAVARDITRAFLSESANMFALPYETGSCAGLVAFYAIVNLPPEELGDAFRELRRVLADDGRLLLSFHLGDERVHRADWWDKPVALDFWFFPRAFVEDRLVEADFEIEVRVERRPYPGIEYPSERAYLLARPVVRDAAAKFSDCRVDGSP